MITAAASWIWAKVGPALVWIGAGLSALWFLLRQQAARTRAEERQRAAQDVADAARERARIDAAQPGQTDAEIDARLRPPGRR